MRAPSGRSASREKPRQITLVPGSASQKIDREIAAEPCRSAGTIASVRRNLVRS